MAVAGIAGAELRFVSMHGFSGKPGPCFDPEAGPFWGRIDWSSLSPDFIDALNTPCAQAKRLASAWRSTRGWLAARAPVSRPTPLQAPRLAGSGTHRTGVFEEKSLGPGSMILAWRIDTAGDEKAATPGSFQPLTGRIQWQNDRGSLRWDVPAGRWLIGTFPSNPGGAMRQGQRPQVDPGSRKPCSSISTMSSADWIRF